MILNFDELLILCKKRNLKMTPQRKWVLECLHTAVEPLTAYEILDVYRQNHNSGEAMTIYRVLTYLEKMHVIHKIHSQNKYKLCDLSHTDSNVQLFLCTRCHDTKEIHSNELQQLLNKTAQADGFKIEDSMLELLGICKNCQQSAT